LKKIAGGVSITVFGMTGRVGSRYWSFLELLVLVYEGPSAIKPHVTATRELFKLQTSGSS
jgi:hypothetical protein